MSAVSFIEVENTLAKFKKLNEAIRNGMITTKECALDCEENEEGSPEVVTLKGIMLEYANMSREISQYDASVRKTVSNFRQNYDQESERKNDIEEMFKGILAEKQTGNKDSDLEENQYVKEFTEQVWYVNHSGINQEVLEDGMASNEEIVISQIVGDRLLCPITKTEMDQPMKNRLCGHCYGKKAIEEHIKRMKHKAKCPVVGCPHIVSMNDLEVDKILARELKKRHK